MLDTTLATTFTPSTNLKGEVAAANWTFLLPSLELDRIVILGNPSPAALTTLKRLGRVTILVGRKERFLASRGTDGRHQPGAVDVVVHTGERRVPFADECADLVFVCGDDYRDEIIDDEVWRAELRRILKKEGVLYFEPGGVLQGARAKKELSKFTARFGPANAFWLTPLGGECHTAVPVQSQRTIAYFLDKRLYAPSITLRTFGAVKGLLKRRRTLKQSRLPDAGAVSRPTQSYFLARVRSAGKDVVDFLGDVECLILKHAPFIRRYGVLLGSSAHLRPRRLPQYLVNLAAESGIDLVDVCHWGVVARGDYSSRKVLFFLLAEDQKRAGAVRPTFVVKMVRDPQYNARLENEHRALRLLEEMGVAVPETAPRAAFWGYHNQLAIIGETAIDGVSFRERTSSRADCPYLLKALDWFTMLGSTTAAPGAATPVEVAMALRTLLTRLAEIYQLTHEEQAFLNEQLAVIAKSQHAFPLVFQHGDPGPWNAVVTPEERVAFLDWEAAEPKGMPLWDLFYFMRSYSVGAARALGIDDRLHGFAEQLLSDTRLSRLMIDRVDLYRRRIGLDAMLVEPLFYTCWMHRALKEATRLSDAQLEQGHYINLLRLCIERRETSILHRLFSQPGSVTQEPVVY